MSLIIKQIDAAKAKEKPYKIADSNGRYLHVSPAGGKSWRCNFKANGKQGTKTFGKYPDLSLSAARTANLAFKTLGTSKATPEFKKVCEAWLKRKLPTLSNGKHQIQVAETLRVYAYPLARHEAG